MERIGIKLLIEDGWLIAEITEEADTGWQRSVGYDRISLVELANAMQEAVERDKENAAISRPVEADPGEGS
jgi:hypothetical protein